MQDSACRKQSWSAACLLSGNWGSSHLAKLRDSISTLHRRCWLLTMGTNLFLPGRGAPSGSATPFSWICTFSRKDIHTPSGGHVQVVSLHFLTIPRNPQGKIFRMARGWESKSVEQQQEERSAHRQTVPAPRSPGEQQRNRKREGLLLTRTRLSQQLLAASNPRHRQMLEQSIAEVDRQLSSLD